MSKYGLFTNFKTQKDRRDELASILLQASQLISTAKGCDHYIIYKDNNDENWICVSEIWGTKEDHDNSSKIDGSMELISKAFPLVDGKPENKVLEVLGGKGIDWRKYYAADEKQILPIIPSIKTIRTIPDDGSE